MPLIVSLPVLHPREPVHTPAQHLAVFLQHTDAQAKTGRGDRTMAKLRHEAGALMRAASRYGSLLSTGLSTTAAFSNERTENAI